MVDTMTVSTGLDGKIGIGQATIEAWLVPARPATADDAITAATAAREAQRRREVEDERMEVLLW
jgi:hypothetical protein